MKALRGRAGGLAVILLALGPAVIATAPSAAAYTPSAATVAAYEARVIYSINVQRVRYGRSAAAAQTCPDWYAEGWAAYLARTGSFYHRSMTAILTGCHATRAAENLARGNLSADGTVAAWMASSGHRANILDGGLTRIGVAAVYADGQWTVVADFTRP
jgi:uncharacterized protein YkwD